MEVNLDIKIAYDDLSEACKQKIKKLEKEFDCTVNLIYPDIAGLPNIAFGTNTQPHNMYDWKDNTVLCNTEI